MESSPVDKPEKPPRIIKNAKMSDKCKLPETYFQTMTGLSFISKVNINEKISVPDKGEPHVSRDTVFTSIFRRLFGESRQETLRFIQQTYADAGSIAEDFAERGDTERLSMVKAAFMETASGVENLCKTYENDKHFTSFLRVLFDEYSVRLGDIKSV